MILAAVAMVLAMAGCKERPGEAPAMEHAVLTVDTTTVETTDEYPATIKGRQDVEIFPQVSGKITSVCVAEGQRVAKGQTLFVIDQVPYRAALRTATANLNAADAVVATARLDCDGKRQLYDNRVVSAFELQKAENTLRSAKAAREQAEAQVVAARNDLSYTVVASPCDGVVGTLPYRAGTLVGPSTAQPLTTVSDNSAMFVYFSIPESRMMALVRRHGSADKALEAMPGVTLFLNDGSRYGVEGRIETMSGVIDSATGSVSLRAVFANDGGLLRSGGSGNVGITDRREGVIAIPQSATYELQDKVFCYRLVDGKAVSTPVKVVPLDKRKLYVVTAGLKAGDVIVAEGVGLLQDGTPIKVRK